MSHQNTNILVYLKQPVRQGQVRKLSLAVRGLRGVVNTEVSKWTRSFLSVSYDPDTTDSKHIIEYVNSHGYSAVLVGM